MSLAKPLYTSLVLFSLISVSGCVSYTAEDYQADSIKLMEDNYGAVKGELPSFTDPKAKQLAEQFKAGQAHVRAHGTLLYDPVAYPVCELSEEAIKKRIAFFAEGDMLAGHKSTAQQTGKGSLAAQASASTLDSSKITKYVLKQTLLAYELRASEALCNKYKSGAELKTDDHIIYTKIRADTHKAKMVNGEEIEDVSSQLTENTIRTRYKVLEHTPGAPPVIEHTTEVFTSRHMIDEEALDILGKSLDMAAIIGDMGNYMLAYQSDKLNLQFSDSSNTPGFFTTQQTIKLAGGRSKNMTYRGKQPSSIYRFQDAKMHGLQETYNSSPYLGNTSMCYEMGERVERPDCLTF